MEPASTQLQLEEQHCEEKAHLMRQYVLATSDYSHSLKVLQDRMGVMSKSEYEKVRSFTEEARRKSEATRMALDKHAAEHGC